MEKYHIYGGVPIRGTYVARGAKNGALPILAATVAVPGIHRIKNCPDISDLKSMYKILKSLGCHVEVHDEAVVVDTRQLMEYKVPEDLMKEMRSSVFLMGGLLSRCGRASISKPGGCKIGKRPIDIHIYALREMGYKVDGNEETISFQGKVKGPCEINLPFPSVGATENIILAGLNTEETITVKNCAKEPEIIDLQNFLNNCGAKISGAGTGIIRIEKSQNLQGTEYEVLGDRIEAATYLMAAAATAGHLIVEKINPVHIDSVLHVLTKMGCNIRCSHMRIELSAPKVLLGGINVKTGPYPDFPTDCQPQLMTLLSIAKGESSIEETIFENRFAHSKELNKMGANIEILEKTAIIKGVPFLNGGGVSAQDLRGGAALIIAGLAADSETEISGINHILRGYENIDKNLRKLGGKIERIPE
ncbi:MAG: UDP-N-acetylglucosamine 1-carboxyvinyltransferase [Eubacteriales bacterium]|nr:UDP-N-acetylglucosamine 1-carboxyvinyltransferase [Eubacteriales bacterium]